MTISGVWAQVVLVAPVITGFAGYRLALLNWKRDKLETETRSVAQMVMLITDAAKIREGTHDLTFSEDTLRNLVGPAYSLRLHAALDMLKTKGRAKKAAAPGYWLFD